MDPYGHNQPPPVMMVVGGAPLPYGSPQYPIPSSVGGIQPTSQSSGSQLTQSPNAQRTQQQLAYQNMQQQQIQQQQQLQQQLHTFWANQVQELETVTEFKNYSLPLARIKKIMKADEDVRMISAEAPVVFSKACELFILELTLRAWNHTEENKRRTLQKCDISAAITRTDVFDFMADLIPKEDVKDEAVATVPRGGGGALVAPGLGDAPPPLPYCYMPPQHSPQVGGTPGMMMGTPMMELMGPPGMIMGSPMMDPMGPPGMIMGSSMMDPTMYGIQQPQMPFIPHQMWQQPPDQQPPGPPDR